MRGWVSRSGVRAGGRERRKTYFPRMLVCHCHRRGGRQCFCVIPHIATGRCGAVVVGARRVWHGDAVLLRRTARLEGFPRALLAPSLGARL